MEEEDRRESFKDYYHQSPALATILTKYADGVKAKRHPIVMQDGDNADSDSPAAPSDGSDENTNVNLVDQILHYTEFTTLFLWEVQASTIG